MQLGVTRDPLEDAIAQADAVLQASDPLDDAIRQADRILQEPPAPSPAQAGPPPLSPLEREVMGNNPATRAAQPLPDYVPPKPPIPMQPRAPLITAGHGGITGFVPPAGEGMLERLGSTVAEGAPQVVRGVAGAIKAAVTPSGPPLPGVPSTVNPKTGAISRPSAIAPETLNAGSDIAEGTFKLLLPAVAAAGIVDTAGTAWALAKTVAGQQLASKIAALAGAGPEAQRFAGNVGAVGAGLPSGVDLARILTETKALARPLVLAGKIGGSGYGPGDVPGYRAPGGFGEFGVPDAPVTETARPRIPVEPRLESAAPEPEAPSPQVPPEPLSPRASEESPTAPLEQRPKIDLTGMGSAMSENLYQRFFERVQAGQPVWGQPEKPPLAEQVVQAAADRGLINTIEDVKRFANMPIAEARAFFAAPAADPAAALEQAVTVADRVLEEPSHAETPLPIQGEAPPVSAPATRDVEGPPATGLEGPAPVVAQERGGDVTPDPLEAAIRQADAVLAPESTAPAAAAPVHEFASTQVDLPPEIAAGLKSLGQRIPAEHLAEEGKEAQPHVTVKYGLHSTDPEALRRVLAEEPPITLTLGKTSFFPNGESNSGDVVKVDVDSPDLHRLNKKIADALPHTDTHPDYKPHATVAYVKPGLGQQYAGDASLEGQTVTVDRVTLSGQDGTLTEIPLTGAPRGATMGAPTDVRPQEATAGTSTREIPPSGTPERSAPASGGLQPSGQHPPRARTRGTSLAQRTSEAESAAIEDLVAHAQQGGHAGDADALREVLRSRLQLIKDWDTEFSDSGHNPQELLRAIAARGGLSISKETALKGELRWLKEFQDTRPSEAKQAGNLRAPVFMSGQVRGVRGVFHDSGGMSVDDMLTSLRQEPRFQHIETLSDLLEELRAAATHEPERQAFERLKKGLGERWWESIGDAVGGEFPDSAQPESGGDISFDPREFEGDVLDTGEVQPRLPEAGAVRDVETPTPEFEAPFSLSGGADTTPQERPRSLFEETPGSPKPPPPTTSKLPLERGSPAVTIREKEYRDVQGFSVSWHEKDPGWPPQSIFVTTRERAEAVRDAVRRGVRGDALDAIAFNRDNPPAKARIPVREKTSGGGSAMRIGPSTTPAPPRGGSTVDAALVPGGRQFVERDVMPALQHAFAELLAVKDDVRALLAPDTVNDAANVAANVVRVHKALEAQELQRAARLLDRLRKQWDRVPKAERLAFAMAVDEGDVSGLPAWQRDAAKLFASINDLYRKAVSARGGFQHGYIDDYYPRQWDRPGRVRTFLRGGLSVKRPFKGRQGFKKARARNAAGEMFSFREMYDAGFRPVHDNPVEAWLHKWDEMRKWISAYDILREHKDVGVTKYIPVDTAHPRGWLRYPESYGTVYGRAAVTVAEAFDPTVRVGLEKFLADLKVRHRRAVNIGHGDAWGYAQGEKSIVSKFGGPEGVIMHELGHILDNRYGLWDRIVNPAPREPYTAKKGKKAGKLVWRAVKQDKATVKVRTTIKAELRALADLRFEGQKPDAGYVAYVRNEREKMANLVHAFLYAPARAKEVAPNSYWALFNVIKAHPELQPLHDIQKDRGMRLAADTREVTIPGKLITGYYYGPPDAVRIMERYLSPGLAGSRAYRSFRYVGGAMTQVQLGLSAFHLVATGLESIISKTAVGVERVSRGAVLPGLKDIAISPAAPFISLWKGQQALTALRSQTPSTQRFANLASQIIQGGGREGWDPFWHNQTAVAKWVQTWRNVAAEAQAGNYPGAAMRTGAGLLRTLPMLIELQAKPVMEYWVPRMKMAAFLDLARLELDDLGDTPDTVEGRKALAKAWDSVDNRFGELIYDNLFWDRRLKDFLLAMMRAPGWSLGTWRELFGAVPAQVGHLAKLSGAGGGGKIPMRMRHVGNDTEGNPRYEAGREPWLTHKFAYFMSALFWIAVFGAVTQYLHTGLQPGEQDDGSIDAGQIPLDLYFPRREREEGTWKRIVLPTQLRDVWAAVHNFPYGLGTMLVHKVNPLVSTITEFLKNEDYWGTEIHSEEDTIPDQVKDALTQLAKELRPISVQSIEQSGHPAESVFGFTPAPSYVTRTPMENYLRDIAPPVHRTKAQAEAAAARRDLRTTARTDPATARGNARTAVQAGALTSRQAVGALRSANTEGIVFAFQRLDLPRALHAYELANPEERRTLQPYLRRKLTSAEVAPPERQALRGRAQRALQLPVAGPAKPPIPVSPR